MLAVCGWVCAEPQDTAGGCGCACCCYPGRNCIDKQQGGSGQLQECITLDALRVQKHSQKVMAMRAQYSADLAKPPRLQLQPLSDESQTHLGPRQRHLRRTTLSCHYSGVYCRPVCCVPFAFFGVWHRGRSLTAADASDLVLAIPVIFARPC